MLIRNNYYTQRRKRIKDKVLEITVLLKSMISKTGDFLLTSDKQLKLDINNIEDEVNKLEEEIESNILEIISLEQLDTNEIKWLFAISRIIRELERVGDQLINVVSISQVIGEEKIQPKIQNYFKQEKAMIELLYDGIYYEDKHKLNNVRLKDKFVNALDAETMQEMQATIENDIKISESQLKLVMASRFLERIGDHLSNVAKVFSQALN